MPESTDNARAGLAPLDALTAVVKDLAAAEEAVLEAIRAKEAAELEHGNALRKVKELKAERRELVRAAKAADPKLTTRGIGAFAQVSATAISNMLNSEEES